MTLLLDQQLSHEELDRLVADLAPRSLEFTGRPGGVHADPQGLIYVSINRVGGPREQSLQRVDPERASMIDLLAGSTDRLLSPAGMALGPDGLLYVADSGGHRIWALQPDGEPRVVAGSANGYGDGVGGEALFRYPADVAFGPDGTCYVADMGNDRIRTISREGVVATLAGSIYDYGDGRGTAAFFRRPRALAVDGSGTCFVADTGNNAVRRVDPDGRVTTLVGSPLGGEEDGAPPGAGLRWPTGIALDREGNVFVADYGSSRVRKIDRRGECSTVLRLPERSWPVSLAATPAGDNVLVLVESRDGAGWYQTRLSLLEGRLGSAGWIVPREEQAECQP